MNRDFNQTMFDKMRGTRIPGHYYDGMYKDGYKPYEIIEAAHNSIIKEHEARQAVQEPGTPMNVHFQVEVKRK